jgi:nicotinate-nucleotide adenylyltransferase
MHTIQERFKDLQAPQGKGPLIGLYGGSFDPIHFGHINLAIEMMEQCHLDEVWFIPARLNPHKEKSLPASPEHRLRMCQLTLAAIRGFYVIDDELRRPGVSYTIDTVASIIAAYSHLGAHRPTFKLIVGDDAIESLPRWHRVEDLVHLVPLLVGGRNSLSSHSHLHKLQEGDAVGLAIKSGLVKTRRIDISSTDVRARIGMGKYCGHLVPEKALDYIYANGLYYTV